MGQMTDRRELTLSGFRVHWDHPNGRDHMIGAFWEDRETAEQIAEMCRCEGMLNVEVKGSHFVNSVKQISAPRGER